MKFKKSLRHAIFSEFHFFLTFFLPKSVLHQVSRRKKGTDLKSRFSLSSKTLLYDFSEKYQNIEALQIKCTMQYQNYFS